MSAVTGATLELDDDASAELLLATALLLVAALLDMALLGTELLDIELLDSALLDTMLLDIRLLEATTLLAAAELELAVEFDGLEPPPLPQAIRNELRPTRLRYLAVRMGSIETFQLIK